MKTPKKSISGSILTAFLFFFLYFEGFSQPKSKFLNFKSDDSMVSLYIIGGVFTFGIIAFVISKIVAKFSKNDDIEIKPSRIITHRRHRYQNKMIKKSA